MLSNVLFCWCSPPPPLSSPSYPLNSASRVDEGAGFWKRRSCRIAYFTHCRASTISPLSRFHRLLIIMPPCEKVRLLETDDQKSHVKKKIIGSKVLTKPRPELAALAFSYFELGQSHCWAITIGLAWPGSRLWAGPGKSLGSGDAKGKGARRVGK